MLPDVIGSHDIAVVTCGDTRTIDASAESGAGNGVHPGIDICLLLREHAPALLLIEKDDGSRGEAFAARGGRSGMRIGLTKHHRVRHSFEFSVQASVKEHEKPESGGFDGGAVATPAIRLFAGRIVEPVAGVGESLVQGFEVGVAGVGIAVEAEVGGLCGRNCASAKEKQADGEPSLHKVMLAKFRGECGGADALVRPEAATDSHGFWNHPPIPAPAQIQNITIGKGTSSTRAD